MTFYYISSGDRRIWLECLGGDKLRKLTLIFCKDVDPIDELMPNNRLESLDVQSCSFIPISNNSLNFILRNNNNEFLPRLKTLKMSENCSGQWSRLFEYHRPYLKSLTLSCPHIGLPSVSQFSWDDTPSLWPNLTVLTLNSGLYTMDTINSLSPHLHKFLHLEKLVLPKSVYKGQQIHLSTVNFLSQTGHPLPNGLRVLIDPNIVHYLCNCRYNSMRQQELYQ